MAGAIQLALYNYEIKFQPTQANANADGLSRLPLDEGEWEGHCAKLEIFTVSQIESLPATAAQLRTRTGTNRGLSRVARYTKGGWP